MAKVKQKVMNLFHLRKNIGMNRQKTTMFHLKKLPIWV